MKLTKKITYRASISDGMSRNAGGELKISASIPTEAWEHAIEWTREGSYDQPTSVTVYLDRLDDEGKWVEEGSRKISVE